MSRAPRNERAFRNLRVGAVCTLRDWRGDSVSVTAFLSPEGEWLGRARSGSVWPIVPRELVSVTDGAAEYFARLKPGARVVLADWEGGMIKGEARPMLNGQWCAVDAEGARWLIEPYRLVEVTP